MRFFANAVAVSGLLGAFAVPALAQDTAMDPATMTCADLMAMDEAGQMEAMTAMEMAAGEASGTAMTEEEAMAAGEEMMPGTMTACEGNGDMMAMDAMASGMMDPATMTCADLMAMDEAGQMAAMTRLEMAAGEASGTAMTEDEAMAAGEQMMPGTMTACEGNPDMTAMEAMQEGM